MLSKNQNNKIAYISEQINNNNMISNNDNTDKFSILNDKINSLSENNNSKNLKQ